MTDKNHKLPRLHVTEPLKPDHTISFSPEQAHYLKNVLRQKEGDHFRAFNGQDGEWLLKITDLPKKSGSAFCQEQIRQQPPASDLTHLLFAPIKKARMDFLIEKAVELGATHLHPVLTDHTEVRKINDSRIYAQMIEAAEQCERMDIPSLEPLVSLSEALQKITSDMQVLAGIERDKNAPYIGEIEITHPIATLIGPEGGFSEDEIRLLTSTQNVTPVSLGQNILRAETAAVKILSYIAKS